MLSLLAQQDNSVIHKLLTRWPTGGFCIGRDTEIIRQRSQWV